MDIKNISNKENYVTMSRPSFKATIRGNNYEISAQTFSDVIENIQIISVDTFEQVYFEDEIINEAIFDILNNIASHKDFLVI